MSNDVLTKVTGRDCLDYIDRPIALVNKESFGQGASELINQMDAGAPTINSALRTIIKTAIGSVSHGLSFGWQDNVAITKFKHNPSRRIVGYVDYKCDDGGLRVNILGSEKFILTNHEYCDGYWGRLLVQGTVTYTGDPILPDYNKDSGYGYYPELTWYYPTENIGVANLATAPSSQGADLEEFMDYHVELRTEGFGFDRPQMDDSRMSGSMLTNDPSTSLVFGEYVTTQGIPFSEEHKNDPLKYLQGDLYSLAILKNSFYQHICPMHFDDGVSLYNFTYSDAGTVKTTNLVSIPYNLILTDDLSFAKEYLRTGAIPPDAYLFPLDWDSLPSYTPQPDPEDDPDDYPNGNDPGDNLRIIDPTPPVHPSITPAMLSNYNWYWLNLLEYSNFIQWFWNDIGNYSGWEDIKAKIQGLYNDVANAVLMVRYMPVDISWIGGAGTPSNIKVGMIEKNGAVSTIDQSASPSIRHIGTINIPKKYNSFVDLAPYSQLSLYLPYHGFIDLDIDIFTGHDLRVYAYYDYLSGTMQYLISCDNPYSDGFIVNTVLVKMAVDVPITLQTKNDRDSATFQNVMSTVGGLLSAGLGVASGNPIGMVMGASQGVQALTSGASQSAPLKAIGTVGETGANYAPDHCYIILRRPTIQGSDKKTIDDGGSELQKGLSTWASKVGQLCGYGYTLSTLANEKAGFTVCHTPRIEFKNTVPMQSEIDEIYDYLSKGVIL